MVAVVLTVFVVSRSRESASAFALRAPSDTLVINSRLNIALPATAIPLRILGKPTWRVSPTTVAHIPHAGAVACDTTGDALLIAENRFSRRSLQVFCRPVKSFNPFTGIRIALGSEPVRMPAVPNRGLDGLPVTLLAGTAQMQDTTIARLENGMIRPVALGRTYVAMDFSGMRTTLGVEVYETVTAGPVTLPGGGMKSWRLPRGRYEINVTPVEGSAAQPLALSVYKANCAPGRQGPQHMHCVTYEEGAFIVRNTRPPGRRSDESGKVLIVRQGW
jgi:hypothetical protein